ncbi:hypothetical protein DSCW_54290 [Desulfosarcina widdelii]|uniref:Uncharacterized protein n=1 Tax=Desulfosarcina widdelii TaxID=947919 RepID=A0A5K7Z7L9_9BACT|nr:hypothetical protein [Desulfosarcina widdelii]BBO78012.1 hypothetical protein DSCW_54290 [Desulfosarcina widdelii]
MYDDFIDDGVNDFWDGPDWQDWMIIGPLSESISRERQEQDRIQKEIENEDDDYWKIINGKED